MAVRTSRFLMVLSDVDIRSYMERGKIRISPELPPDQFGSCSIDLRLGSEFSIFEHSRYPYIDVREKGAIQDIMRTLIVKPGEPFVLQPREFALAITEESLELDDDVLGKPKGAEGKEIQVAAFVAQPDAARLKKLAEAVRTGALTIPIARKFKLSEAREAQRLSEQGGIDGKIALVI